MKGINVKKIAALAAGTLLVGSAVAFADVMYGNTQLVDQNGQPTVKVVVGASAFASDGVAGANIAAAIANQAYRSSTLRAETTGTATCAAGSASGTGTCAVSNEQVTLEITAPGFAVGAHQFETLLGDYIDKELQDRKNVGSENRYQMTIAETADDSNPYTNGTTGFIGQNIVALYRIGADQFTPFKTVTITDSRAGKTYKEEQNFWAEGKTKFQTSTDEIEGFLTSLTYNAKFVHDDFGIPVCTGTVPASKDYSYCQVTENVSETDQTDGHRMKIKFLGEDWILSDMSPLGTTVSESDVIEGGSIRLAKEAAYGIRNVGETLDVGAVKIKLSDISVAVGAENKHPAIVDIIDAAGAVVEQTQIDPTTTKDVTVAGVTYKIHVYQTSPGFTLNAKWAEMAVYAQEITLDSSEDVDDDNEEFTVYLGWKNKGASTSGSIDNKVDHLRNILIYGKPDEERMSVGDSFTVLADPAVYDLEFNGIDLTSADYDRLYFEIVTGGGSFTVYNESSGLTTSCQPDVEMIITSEDASGFSATGANGEKIHWVLGNWTDTDCYKNAVYLQRSTSEKNQYKFLGWTTATAAQSIRYTKAGSTGDAIDGGALGLLGDATTGWSANVSEDMGRFYDDSNSLTALQWIATNQTATITFQPTGGIGIGDDKLNYTTSGPATTGYTNQSYEEGFISQRGTEFVSIDDDTVELKVATKIAKALYTLKTSGTSSNPDTTEVTLKEGDSYEVGGVTVKVKSIDETVGACTVSGTGSAPACTVDQTAVKAVILPNNVASVEVSEPYKLTSKMVVLDSSAPAGAVVSVGGPVVNTVTAEILSGANAVDFNTNSVVVKEVGNKVVVAGLSAEDTLTAADQFIAGIKRQ